jgi:putative ABC transport system permease protein
VLRRYQNLGVRTVGDDVASWREEAAFRSTLLQGLVWIVTLIALLGVSNTQALSLIERTRMLRAETMVVGLLGTTLGLLVGLAAAWLAMRELSGFSTAGLVTSASGLLGTALVAVVASVLAARATARRATRINVLRAIATE